MRSRRSVLTGTVTLATAAVLAGCGTPEGEEEEEDEEGEGGLGGEGDD